VSILLRVKHRDFLLVFLLYAIVAVVFTWPLILNLSSFTYGYAGDNFGFIYHLWWWKKSLFDPNTNFFFSTLQEAPFGKIINPDSGAFVFYILAKFFTLLTNEVAGYNLFLLVSFPLSGMFTYLLVKEVLLGTRIEEELSQNRRDSKYAIPVAFWAGLVFAFCPYHFWKAYNHLDLTQIQWFPFYFYGLVKLFRKPSVKTSLLAAVGLALVALSNFYYGYFAFLGSAVFIPVAWLLRGFFASKDRRASRLSAIRLFSSTAGYLLLLGVLSVLLIAPFLQGELSVALGKTPIPGGLAGEVYQRPMDTLLLLSARPWSYILPSVDHPVMGAWSQGIYDKIGALGNDFKYQSPFTHEGTVFVGWTTLIAAIVGVGVWLLRATKRLCLRIKSVKSESVYYATHTARTKPFMWMLPFLLTAGWLFLVSMPPFVYIAGKNILLPTYFLHHYFPMFRAYSRLGVLVLLCLLIPAAYGVYWVVRKFDVSLREDRHSVGNRGRVSLSRSLFLIPSLLSLTIIFEFLNFPPAKVIDISPPPVYKWLASQNGDFVIVEYPREFNVAEALLFQRIHGKALFNPHTGSAYEHLWSGIENVQDPHAPEKLKALGVKYVLLHNTCTFTEDNPVDSLWYTRCYNNPIDTNALPEGLRLVGNFSGVEVLEVY